jgi:hypothetical protein
VALQRVVFHCVSPPRIEPAQATAKVNSREKTTDFITE